MVSTYPLASQVLGHLRHDGRVSSPVVTYLTDMSVHRLWVAAGVDLHLATHPVAARQAVRWGARTMVVRPAVADVFHPMSSAGERVDVRRRWGLPLDRAVALVVGGSWGVGRLADAMTDVAATGLATPVALCATNEALRDRLVRRGFLALGWVEQMAPLLRSADVVIQNAGGLTSLQALACGVPVLSYRCLPGHGVANAEALQAAGFVAWVRDREALDDGLARTMNHTPARLTGEVDPASVIAALARPVPPTTAVLPARPLKPGAVGAPA